MIYFLHIYGVPPEHLSLLDISSKQFLFHRVDFSKVGMRDKNGCIKKSGVGMWYEEKLGGVRVRWWRLLFDTWLGCVYMVEGGFSEEFYIWTRNRMKRGYSVILNLYWSKQIMLYSLSVSQNYSKKIFKIYKPLRSDNWKINNQPQIQFV